MQQRGDTNRGGGGEAFILMCKGEGLVLQCVVGGGSGEGGDGGGGGGGGSVCADGDNAKGNEEENVNAIHYHQAN